VAEAPEPVEIAAPTPEPTPTPVEPVPEPTPAAPEETTTEIVTEAETPTETAAAPPPATAPSTSVRPAQRPAAPRQVAQPAPTAPETPTPPRSAGSTSTASSESVDAALREALEGAASAPDAAPVVAAPSGPPLTAGEKDALRVSVQKCWNVGALSSEALRVTVVVALSMNRDGTPDNGTIRMLSSSGGSATAAGQAYEAARRAIIRCGTSGFPLPVEKYGQWQNIEMTFDPSGMRLR
jgi:hypothetical protein